MDDCKATLGFTMRAGYILVLCMSVSLLSSCSAFEECTGYKNKCEDGFVCITEEDPEVCMPYAVEDNGYNCTYTKQCPKDSHCQDDEQVCQCDEEKYILTDDGCVGDAGECSESDNPCDEGLVCIESETPSICMPIAVEANGYNCSYTEQCPKDSECDIKKKEEEGECKCTDDATVITDEGCVKQTIGGECTLLSPCNIDNCHCSKFRVGLFGLPTGKCVCDKGYEPTVDKTQCQLQGNATDDNDYYCEKNWQCEGIYEEDEKGDELEVKCNTKDNVCKCNTKGKYPLHQECSDGISSSCVTNEDCSERITNSLCVKGECVCMEDHLPLKDGFHCEQDPSEENGYQCSYDEQCETLEYGYLDSMTCVEGKCNCGEDNVIIDNKCVHGKIGSDCLLSSSCGIKDSECQGMLKKSCECKKGLSPSDDKRACGYKCDADDSSPCSSNSTTCVEGICQCERGYVTVYEKDDEDVQMLCLEYASEENDFDCEYQEQCDHITDTSFFSDNPAQCKDGTCTCEEEHYTIENNKCLRGLGAECSTFVNQCDAPNTMCNLFVKGKKLLKGTCVCKFGFVEHEGYCEPFECRVSLRCPKHSDCNREKNLCVCDDGYVKKDNFLRDECIPLSSPDDEFSCEITSQCSNIEDTSSDVNQTVVCNTKTNRCQCVQELWTPVETSEGFYECVPGAGATCDEDEECQLGNPDSTCKNEECTCNKNYVAVDSTKKCVPVSNQAEDYACTYNEQCGHIPDKSGSFFSKKIATCNSEAGQCTCANDVYIIYVDDDKPKCTKALGGSCSMDFYCSSVKNAVCLENDKLESVCQCKEGYMLPDYEMECIPYATPKTNYACDRDEECFNIIDDYEKPGGKAKCVDKQCQCSASDWFMYGPNGAGQIKCARELGATCTRNEDCYNFVPYSTCEDVCVCMEGTKEDKDEQGNVICNAGSSALVSLVTLLAAYLVIKMTS